MSSNHPSEDDENDGEQLDEKAEEFIARFYEWLRAELPDITTVSPLSMRSNASREFDHSGKRWARGLMVALGSAGSGGLIQGRCLWSFFFTD
ncbi:hypothetical protein EJ110_NYTH41093 [Nymphaea thermarum]|nr:hypothetical protein EJ110_NYTH41093 [Nymphaea thermarum]